ncbi:YagK/YfjJ domain-containing protein [Marinobacter zhejiangensis]|uniref:YagK/YfjJ C-terminal domain-containing protein n=1 Tax=Marinobacter zhejiangensis TaxID=488535 RepID=A0A1I4NI71_9GAMM|nr:inovirus-type Gp2 protein [Marinobacter zhejiangensis]SFM15055.1 Protein of unknown function [Marinobacter zhejiangensis]
MNIYECSDTLTDLKHIEKLTKIISKTRSIENVNQTPIKKSELVRLLSIPETKFKVNTPNYTSNPYAIAFFSAKAQVFPEGFEHYDIKSMLCGNLKTNITYLLFVDAIHHFTSLDSFRTTVSRHEKAQSKRKRSTNNYIDALTNSYARLTVVRIDLHLKPDPWKTDYTSDLLNEMQMYWAKMRRDLYESKRLPRSVGFLCSLELGHITGFHFHLMVFFDGSLYQSDINLATIIGEHWRATITHGEGWYYNCNANKSQYKRLGIGRIEYWDKEAIENMKATGCYLAKIDYSLDAVIGNAQAFFRSNMPSKRSGLGRPRSKPALSPEPDKTA